jgi:hypothetical protein
MAGKLMDCPPAPGFTCLKLLWFFLVGFVILVFKTSLEVLKFIVRKFEFPWSFDLILVHTDDFFQDCATWWFCKRDLLTYRKVPPATLSDQMPSTMGTASVVGPCCLWTHLCKSFIVVFGLGRANELTKKHHKDILLCWCSSSMSDEIALLGIKMSKWKTMCQ